MQRSQVYAILLVTALSICAIVQLRKVSPLIPASWSDLYDPWKASQAAIHHQDPYSADVTRQIQMGIYGRALGPNDVWDPQKFVYPAHIILFLAPSTLLPWTVARFTFAALAPIVVGGTLWLWLTIAGLRLSTARQILLYGLVITSWPATWAYQLQQPSLFVLGVLSLALFYFSRERDVLGGVLLAVATVKPSLTGLIVVWLVCFAAFNRRWKFVGAFAAVLAVLIGASELIVPGWIGEWLRAANEYAHEPYRLSLLGHLFGSRAGLCISALLVAAAVVRLIYTRPGLLASAALLLSITVCITPTEKWMIYNNLFLIPAAVMLVAAEPSNKLKIALRTLAKCSLIWLSFAPPITLLLMFILRWNIPLLPFLEFNAALCITIGALVLADRPAAVCFDVQPVTTATASAVS